MRALSAPTFENNTQRLLGAAHAGDNGDTSLIKIVNDVEVLPPEDKNEIEREAAAALVDAMSNFFNVHQTGLAPGYGKDAGRDAARKLGINIEGAIVVNRDEKPNET